MTTKPFGRRAPTVGAVGKSVSNQTPPTTEDAEVTRQLEEIRQTMRRELQPSDVADDLSEEQSRRVLDEKLDRELNAAGHLGEAGKTFVIVVGMLAGGFFGHLFFGVWGMIVGGVLGMGSGAVQAERGNLEAKALVNTAYWRDTGRK